VTLPRGVTTLLNKAGPAWTHRIQSTTGVEVEVTALSEDEDGAGHRRRETRTEVVDSIGVRFDHPDGRAAVALWWRREGKTSFAFDFAQRGRHAGENVPVTLNARDLGAYLMEEL
jgi:hypothetical protein